MADADSARVSFPKLNDANYATWAVMMAAYLTSKELFDDIVEISVDAEDADGQERPQSDVDAEIARKRKARSKKKCNQARAEMILRVEPGQLAHMRAADPLDMWLDLKAVHRARGFAATLAQRKKFLAMKMSKGQTMTAWIGEVKEQAFQMEEAGTTVPEEDQILTILGGLPATYTNTIAMLDSVPATTRTLDYVITQLLSAETQMGSRSSGTRSVSSDSDHNSAYVARSSVRCYVCDESGHFKRDCPYRSAIDAAKKRGTAAVANVAFAVDVSDGDEEIEW